METQRITREYRLAHWSEILRERSLSGMNIKSYCETHGIHENMYYYWQRKLREAACEEAAQSSKQHISAKAEVPHGWTSCEVAITETKDGAVKNGELSIEIGKCRIKVGIEVDNGLLTSVCRTLISLC